MATAICRNRRNYALTVNNSYQIIENNNNFITIINDRGLRARYSTDLFRIEADEAMPQQAAEPINRPVPIPPPVEIFTDTQLLENNRISRNGNTIRIVVDSVGTTKTIDLDNFEFSILSSAISCGVKQLDGITTICDEIDEFMEANFNDDFTITRKKIFELALEYYLRIERTRFLLISTNEGSIGDEYVQVLDENSNTSTDWQENPNSGNQIKVWILSNE